MPAHLLLISALCGLLVVAACGDDRHGAVTDTLAPDASDTADSAGPGDDVADAVPLDATPDTADATPDAAVLPAGAPVRANVALSWAIQSDAGSQGVQLQSTLPMPDGDLIAIASFAGTVTFGGHSLSSPDEATAGLFVTRVTPLGEVRYLAPLCVGCWFPRGLPTSDGAVLLVGAFAPTTTLAWGTAGELTLTSEEGAFGAIVLAEDGTVTRGVTLGTGNVEVRALSRGPGGGYLFGGFLGEATFADGTTTVVQDGVFYPGQAFVARLDADLAVLGVERVTGTAASNVNMLVPDGDGWIAVGDFGGYPLGVDAVFGAGTPGEARLEAVSSDDDPAMDVFVARWSAPGEVAYARRVRNYTNGPRQPTFLRRTPAGDVETLIAGASALGPEGEHYRNVEPFPERYRYALARFDGAGALVGGQALFSQQVVPIPGVAGYVGTSVSWGGSTIILEDATETLTFDVPEDTPELESSGIAVAQWRADGGLARAGLVWMTTPSSRWPLSLQASAPQPDGSALVVLHGSAPVSLDGGVGDAVALDPGAGYERLVFARVALVDR